MLVTSGSQGNDWTLVTSRDGEVPAPPMADAEDGLVIVLRVLGQEVRLRLYEGGRATAIWVWNSSGIPLGMEFVPDDEDGTNIREALGTLPPVLEEHLGIVSPTEGSRMRALWRDGAPTGHVVTSLVGAIGLPTAVTDHLMGWGDLAAQPTVVHLRPQRAGRFRAKTIVKTVAAGLAFVVLAIINPLILLVVPVILGVAFWKLRRR